MMNSFDEKALGRMMRPGMGYIVLWVDELQDELQGGVPVAF